MKKINAIVLILLVAGYSYSQNKVICFSPAGVVNKLRLKYEVSKNDYSGFGFFSSLYYGRFKGFRLEAFYRLYPSRTAPEGFYIQAKISGGYFWSDINYYYIAQADTFSMKYPREFLSPGAGTGLGYQFIYGKKNRAIDLFFGIHYSGFTISRTFLLDNRNYFTEDGFIWYVTGPGSFLNGYFGFGFLF